MGKIRPGNKKNSALNGEMVTHVRKGRGEKRLTSKLRRNQDKKEIKTGIKEDDDKYLELPEDDMN